MPIEKIKDYSLEIANEINLAQDKVQAAIRLLSSGSTVPFIARYRKEITGSLDEVAITQIRDRLHQLKELDHRRDVILESIDSQGKLTNELKGKILTAKTLTVLEDIYLPFRPKRRTRGTIAKENGLEPLAKLIFQQKNVNVQQEAKKYIDAKKKLTDTQEVLAQARDIIAEWLNEDQKVRSSLRKLFESKGMISSKIIKGKEQEGDNYKDYFQWEESIKAVPSHRILAVRRGEKEGFLLLKVQPPANEALSLIESLSVRGSGEDSQQVKLAAADSYKRLLSLSLETEMRLALKKERMAKRLTYLKTI